MLKVTSLYATDMRMCHRDSYEYIIKKQEWRYSDNIQNVLLQYWSENSRDISCVRSGIVTHFSPTISVLPCQTYCTYATHLSSSTCFPSHKDKGWTLRTLKMWQAFFFQESESV